MYWWIGRACAFLVLLLVVIVGSPSGAPGADAASPTTSGANLSAVPGTIAYTRNYLELHIVQPDGSNDKTVWTEPGSGNTLNSAGWRPDAKEIAFSSNHAQLTSQFISDIYGIQPDGAGLRRISNPPDPSQYGSYAKGTVVVTVTDFDIAGPFAIWMEGASTPQQSSGSGTLTFNDVAIFPGQVQFPVAMNGSSRWMAAGGGVEVQPGESVSTSININSASRYDFWGAFSSVWRSDGAQIDFPVGSICGGYGLPTYPAAGELAQPLMQFNASMCIFDRGPTPGLANQILYYTGLGPDGNEGFYRAQEGSATGGWLVHDLALGEQAFNVQWLPDGSGFLFSKSDASLYYAASNIYEYDFGTQATTQLTFFTTQFAVNLSVSPDGTTIVFDVWDQTPGTSATVLQDLWIMPRNGSAAPKLFVKNGGGPSWSRTSPPGR
jgi:hypothetical protein